jgi:hypothetical protein
MSTAMLMGGWDTLYLAVEVIAAKVSRPISLVRNSPEAKQRTSKHCTRVLHNQHYAFICIDRFDLQIVTQQRFGMAPRDPLLCTDIVILCQHLGWWTVAPAEESPISETRTIRSKQKNSLTTCRRPKKRREIYT